MSMTTFQLCRECGQIYDQSKKHVCRKPRISPELAAKIAAEIAHDFIKNNCDVYADVSDDQMIEAIAELIERYGNESV